MNPFESKLLSKSPLYSPASTSFLLGKGEFGFNKAKFVHRSLSPAEGGQVPYSFSVRERVRIRRG